MLRWARGEARLDHIRNEDIRKEADVKPVETFLENKRLKWFGHCLRREGNHICAKSLRLEVSGRRSRGRPKKRWRDNIPGDMNKYQLTEDMAQYRKYWITKILAGPAQGDGQEMWERWEKEMGGLLLSHWLFFLTMNYFSHCTTWNGIPFTFLVCSTSYVVYHALCMLVIYVLVLFIYYYVRWTAIMLILSMFTNFKKYCLVSSFRAIYWDSR